ncbi:MAG TPA: nuclear transport factor 2 family protein [Burkholderiaceae bacterium]|nr:nuclear transport factor 2 family protein [Burkholderiaceae bacterium]
MSPPTAQMLAKEIQHLRALVEQQRDHIGKLESRAATHDLVSRYMSLCDVVDLADPLDIAAAARHIGELFSEDAVWESIGRSEAEFGRLNGRAAIVKLFQGADPALRKFQQNFHLLTTPRITAQTTSAVAQFTLLAAVRRADGESSWRCARNTVRCASDEHGQWLIHHFSFETLGTWSRSST